MKKIYEVYIDIFFAVNAMLDLVVIVLVKQLLHYKSTIVRMVAAAMAGSFVLSLYICISIRTYPIVRGGSYIIAYGAMGRIAFPECRGRAAVRAALSIYIVSFLVNGIWSWAGFDVGDCLKLGLCSLLVYGIVAMLFRIYRHMRGKEQLICDVHIRYRQRDICLKGLWDTGNCLRSPYHGRGISVVAYDSLKEYMPEGIKTCIESAGVAQGEMQDSLLFYVPYQTIDSGGGLLPVIEAESMWIQMENERKEYQKPLLGISQMPVGDKGRFQIVLTTDG